MSILSILGDRQLLFVVSPSSRLPGFTCLPLCSTIVFEGTQASIFDITNHGVQISFFKIWHSTGSRLQDISLFPSFETKTKQPPRELQKSDEKTLAPLTTKSDFLVDTCSLVVGERIFGSKITKSEKSFGN